MKTAMEIETQKEYEKHVAIAWQNYLRDKARALKDWMSIKSELDRQLAVILDKNKSETRDNPTQ